jgi:hypothetical protein
MIDMIRIDGASSAYDPARLPPSRRQRTKKAETSPDDPARILATRFAAEHIHRGDSRLRRAEVSRFF